jgi:hypothetical protein
MKVSGKKIVGFGVIVLVVMLASTIWVRAFHKGLIHNTTEEQKLVNIKSQMNKMRDYILIKLKEGKPITLGGLSAYCGDYEFLYLPENYNDMRKVFILTRNEITVRLKNYEGDFFPNTGSLGFCAIMGGDFRVKDIATSDLMLNQKGLFRTKENQAFGVEADPVYLEKNSKSVFLIPIK